MVVRNQNESQQPGQCSDGSQGQDKEEVEGPENRLRILFIDAYDSFSNNIIALLSECLDTTANPYSIKSIKINDREFFKKSRHAFHEYLANSFDAVVVGPGPGNPTKPSDVGIIRYLWSLSDERTLPVLGICLGFQCMCIAAGAGIRHLRKPRHGQITEVVHSNKSIFAGVGEIKATQYHSLHVGLDHDIQIKKEVKVNSDLWEPSDEFPLLEPLAWDSSDKPNGAVLMAAKLRGRPFWGVQYHPESICTNAEGKKIIDNWLREAKAWLRQNRPKGKAQAVRTGVSSPTSWKRAAPNDVSEDQGHAKKQQSGVDGNGMPLHKDTGRFSILGLVDEKTIKLHYYMSERRVVVTRGSEDDIIMEHTEVDFWSLLADFKSRFVADGGDDNVPFWGGCFMTVNYEACLETIGVNATEQEIKPRANQLTQPDITVVVILRSVVIDHQYKKVFVQSITPGDQKWLRRTGNKLKESMEVSEAKFERYYMRDMTGGRSTWNYGRVSTEEPQEEDYKGKVRQCQAYIQSGDSYELCLTDQTVVHVPQAGNVVAKDWQLYENLQKQNPAPFGAYVHLGAKGTGLTIISSSPERFFNWSRSGKCQFRPIKGTMRKTAGTTRRDADEFFQSVKERAELLMITDLMRHDLQGVLSDTAGAGTVKVPKVFHIEEHQTVYQQMSVITGNLRGTGKTGIDVLRASLPPGSMTGAPKKRSCELLQQIEGYRARGLYSGILGHFDVGGGGDFSVVIRTAVKWDEDTTMEEPRRPGCAPVAMGKWRIGAGGAVTALSTPKDEFEEMVVKRNSVLHPMLNLLQ
ncbi:para-aminobenzoate synthase [Rhizodiscina lignyota]|uniref:aminodeoxychorismate synthase n=1 Tax=Rhizodiscina lignyota TaxID=1504668 RepID=A0A9P4M8Q5_9PEZI|nr:para-aminobenzoate synthase [Rhizodiscina lignyota]